MSSVVQPVNNSWFYWWFSAQPAVAETSNVADATSSRIYIDELKKVLKEQLRAERAECRLDLTNPDHLNDSVKI